MKSRAKIESHESRMPDEEYDVEDNPLVYVFVIITMSNQKRILLEKWYSHGRTGRTGSAGPDCMYVTGLIVAKRK